MSVGCKGVTKSIRLFFLFFLSIISWAASSETSRCKIRLSSNGASSSFCVHRSSGTSLNDINGLVSHCNATTGTSLSPPSFFRLTSVTWNLYKLLSFKSPVTSAPCKYSTLPTYACRNSSRGLRRFCLGFSSIGFVRGFLGFFAFVGTFFTFRYDRRESPMIGCCEPKSSKGWRFCIIWVKDSSWEVASTHSWLQKRRLISSRICTVLAQIWWVGF